MNSEVCGSTVTAGLLFGEFVKSSSVTGMSGFLYSDKWDSRGRKLRLKPQNLLLSLSPSCPKSLFKSIKTRKLFLLFVLKVPCDPLDCRKPCGRCSYITGDCVAEERCGF